MFENNKDLYPTPKSLVNKMIFSLDFNMIHSILEPSAGSGNIVEVLKEKDKPESSWRNDRRYNFDIDCVEIDQNLRHILKGKGFRVVHDDFLTYETMKEYDLIIANFPFSNGVKHMLKAIEMQRRNGGAIVALLNAETLRNQCSNDRITLSRYLEEYNADIQFIQDAFTDAERKTGVEVALIKMQLPETKRESFILSVLNKAKEITDNYVDYENTQLADSDFFKAIVTQYNYEVEAGVNLIKEYRAMAPTILCQFGKNKNTGETIQTGGCMLNLDLSVNKDKYNNALSVNGYIKEVRGKYWDALFHNENFVGQLTEKLRQDFYQKVDELKEYDFTLYNIYQIKIDMQSKVTKGIEDTIVELFDELSHEHSWDKEYSKNIHYYNGWKTNKSWIINKKVIIPLNGFRDLAYSWGRYDPTDYKVVNKLQDIEKCFNYLDGGLTDAVDLKQSLKFAEEYGETKNIQLKYFTVTFYKKGTCHITFSNDELLKKFNIFGSQHKGWLPPSYGKKQYSEMTKEEKEVVNEFEGEQEYQKVMANQKYYLFDSNSLNLLEEKDAV